MPQEKREGKSRKEQCTELLREKLNEVELQKVKVFKYRESPVCAKKGWKLQVE